MSDPLDPLPERERDLGTLATPKRQEVLAPDIQPLERCPECNMPVPTHADECPVLDRPMFPAPKLDANLRRGHHTSADVTPTVPPEPTRLVPLVASDPATPRSTAGPGVGGRSEPPIPKDDRSEANIRTRRKRRQRARAKAARERQIAQLEFDLRRVLRAAASAMERCEVATDPSGAADEASDILAQVVTLSGELVCEHYGCRRPRPDPPCKQVDTTPGGTWVYKCGHLIGK